LGEILLLDIPSRHNLSYMTRGQGKNRRMNCRSGIAAENEILIFNINIIDEIGFEEGLMKNFKIRKTKKQIPLNNSEQNYIQGERPC